MPTLKKGTKVKQKVQIIKGEIKEVRIADGTEILYIVGYKDEFGNEQERAFHEDQIEVSE